MEHIPFFYDKTEAHASNLSRPVYFGKVMIQQTHSVELSNTKLNIITAGEGDPLLLVHGFPLDHSMWGNQLEALSESYKVIAPDLRGFGKSTSNDETTQMADFAKDLAELLDVLGINSSIHLCGLSMGGYISFEFWNLFADRLKSLILCDTRAAEDSEETKENKRYKVAKHVLEFGTEALSEAMMPKLFSEASRTENTQIVDSTQNVIQTTLPQSVAAALLGMAKRTDFTDKLGSINIPTLAVCGEFDEITPLDEMKEMAAKMPNCQFATIEGAGHMAPLEKPEVVNQEISNFLKSI